MKQQFLLYCQACGRKIFAQETVLEFMGFRICDNSNYCLDKIKNLPIFFNEIPMEMKIIEIDPTVIGRYIRRGFTRSKYVVNRVNVFSTSHFQFKTNILLSLDIDRSFENEEADPELDKLDKIEKAELFANKILKFEGILRTYSPKAVEMDPGLTLTRLKRTLKTLRKIYKTIKQNEPPLTLSDSDDVIKTNFNFI